MSGGSCGPGSIQGRSVKGRNRISIIAGILLLSTASTVAAGSGRGDFGEPLWLQGRCGARSPHENFICIGPAGEQRHFGFFSTCTRPYGLGDLYACSVRAGMAGHVGSLWIEWSLLAHPLYREDRAAVAFGWSVRSRWLRIGLKPAVHRRKVLGFEAETAAELSAFSAFSLGSRFSLGVEERITDIAGGACDLMALTASFEVESLTIFYERNVRGGISGDARMGVEVHLCDHFSLLSGYRIETDEMAFGVLAVGRGYIAGVAFRNHPVLGRTGSAGVGRVWEW